MTSLDFLKQYTLKQFIWTSSPITAVLVKAVFVCLCVHLFFFNEIGYFVRPVKLYTSTFISDSLYFLRPLLTASQCYSNIDGNVFSIDYILITNFSAKILISSTCFEPQVLIFRRIQLYTCSIWYCHSLWEFLMACRYTDWVTVPYAACVQLYPPEDEHLRLETCKGD